MGRSGIRCLIFDHSIFDHSTFVLFDRSSKEIKGLSERYSGNGNRESDAEAARLFLCWEKEKRVNHDNGYPQDIMKRQPAPLQMKANPWYSPGNQDGF